MAKLTHLAPGVDGWYLLFTGQEDDWLYIKRTLKGCSRGPYKGAWYVGSYQWPHREKRGAWWVSNSVLFKVSTLFSNFGEMLFSDSLDQDFCVASEPPVTPVKTLKVPTSLPEAFTVLKLSMTADKDKVKKAYHDLATVYHPDHGGDADKMKAINIANDIILQWIGSRAS